jgi:methylase of polypeptide subunit release factors
MLLTSKPVKEIFCCPEESNFYSNSLETLVLNNCTRSDVVVEFGSGDGSPVINSLTRTKFDGVIHGFDLSKEACKVANSKIKESKLSNKYIIHNSSFFDASRPDADYLISNPPYLPAWDNDLYQPLLHGGIDGNAISKQLLSLDYENVMLMVSSYCDPKGMISYAKAKGYYIPSFVVSPLEFGYYSSEPKVKNRIEELRKENRAFYSKNIYLLAGVVFKKRHSLMIDLSEDLAKIMTSL